MAEGSGGRSSRASRCAGSGGDRRARCLSLRNRPCIRVGQTGSLAPDAASLIAHCRERLAAYKVPRQVEVVSDLPKTPTGKIRRAALRTGPTSSNA
ncbi:AMP-binding enzyme [Novosphingobium lindaniclasticum]|uniref:AMP-binding enzyme n=1 Tax=Novosphingobium lindaniclasticum TaxID=1329895 RepID=UPI00389935BF